MLNFINDKNVYFAYPRSGYIYFSQKLASQYRRLQSYEVHVFLIYKNDRMNVVICGTINACQLRFNTQILVTTSISILLANFDRYIKRILKV